MINGCVSVRIVLHVRNILQAGFLTEAEKCLRIKKIGLPV